MFDSEYIGLYKDVCTFLLGRLIRKWFNIHVNIISYLCSFDEFSVLLFLVRFDPCSKLFCEFLGEKKGSFLSLVLQNENLLCKKLLLNEHFLRSHLLWMHHLSVAHFQSSLLGGCNSKSTQTDDWKWATDKSCIHNKWLLKKSTLEFKNCSWLKKTHFEFLSWKPSVAVKGWKLLDLSLNYFFPSIHTRLLWKLLITTFELMRNNVLPQFCQEVWLPILGIYVTPLM